MSQVHAPTTTWFILFVFLCVFRTSFASSREDKSFASSHGENRAFASSNGDKVFVSSREEKEKEIKISDSVTVRIPEEDSSSGRLISFEIDAAGKAETGRSKRKKLMQRILPLFIMPFLIQSTIVPFFLGMLKFMLFKSLMVGKFALLLILLNAFKNHNSVKGRTDEHMAGMHYGYQGYGMEEIGSFLNNFG